MKTLEQLASTAEEWIRSRYGVVRGHPEWRALMEAFEAGQASARAACRAEALEEAAQVAEKIPTALEISGFFSAIVAAAIREMK